MTKITRRRVVQGLTLTGLSSSGFAMERLPDWLKPKPRTPLFPDSVETWDAPQDGSLPRSGITPPADFSFPIRTTLPFAHGVASGDPLEDRVIIWTRITLTEYPNTDLEGQWRIATDPAMKHVINSGDFSTNSDQDWTVKIDADQLAPYTVYYYQFYYDGAESCVGRTRTAPASWEEQPHIRFAVCACSSYFSGHMNGYGRIADKKDIDFVIHCGDYIYDFPDSHEYLRVPGGDEDGDTNPDFRAPLTLAEMRRRYALYRSDPNLFRAHQQHPWLIIWDNHDIGTQGELVSEETYQAFWEWTPSRQPDPNDIFRRHERIPYGSMADIYFTDRHYTDHHQTEHIPGDQAKHQEYLGTSQNAYLREELLASQDRNADWRIFINQAFIGQLYLINPPAHADWVLELLLPNYNDGVLLSPNQWDGYPEERTDLINFLADNEINNNLFVTGDMHMNWASNVAADPGTPSQFNPATGEGSVGVEFAPSSISRGGADETIRGMLGGSDKPGANVLAYIGSGIVSNVIKASNPNCRYMEWSNHGYGIVDLQQDKAIMEFWWTPIRSHKTSERLGEQIVSWKDSNHMERVKSPVAIRRFNDKDQELAYEIEPDLLFEY